MVLHGSWRANASPLRAIVGADSGGTLSGSLPVVEAFVASEDDNALDRCLTEVGRWSPSLTKRIDCIRRQRARGYALERLNGQYRGQNTVSLPPPALIRVGVPQSSSLGTGIRRYCEISKACASLCHRVRAYRETDISPAFRRRSTCLYLP